MQQQIEAVQNADQLSVVEAATQEGFIVASTANVFTSILLQS
mgnify:CR=1 FL=1